MSLIQDLRKAEELHGAAACQAFDLFKSYAPRAKRVPGCDTVLRLAYRIFQGKNIEEAAAREYLYRWSLTIDQLNNQSRDVPTRINASPLADHFAPHLLGL